MNHDQRGRRLRCNGLTGFTLLEMIIAVLILSIIAAVAIPRLSSTEAVKLDIAAGRIADAARFARAEAMRTSSAYGVIFDTTAHTARVYTLVSGVPTYTVYHPVDKKLYTLNTKTDSITAGVNLQSYSIGYQGVSGNQAFVGFSPEGVPGYSFSGTQRMLNPAATITLGYVGQTRVVNVSPMTGRVTVQ